MKKLIALSAAAVMASSAAMADVAISGTASVSYDDNGSGVSTTTYDAGLSIVGTAGGTTLTAAYDLEADDITALDLSTTIGPVSVAADMHETVNAPVDDGDGDARHDSADRSVTISLDVPVGGLSLAVDDSGDLTVTGSTAGVTVSHTIADDSSTTVSASIAGVDVNVTRAESTTTTCGNSGGCPTGTTTAAATTAATKGTATQSSSTTWDLATTVSGIALTLNSGNDVTATFGLAGNTMVVSHFGEDAAAVADYDNYKTDLVAAYSTVAITRDLTSGATLTATYKTSDDSLTLKAAVSF